MLQSAFAISILAAGTAVLYNYLPAFGAQTYCYSSVTSLSPDVPNDANCFTVTRSGTISRVFAADPTSSYQNIEGHAIPGLWDGHGHLLMYGELLNSVNLFGAKSLDEVRERIKDYMSIHPTAGTKDEWIRGVGWDQAAYGRMPTASDLEIDFPGKYIMLDRIDVHCTWVSSAVLDLLPSPLPASPSGGEIVDPPGVFCDNAMPIVLEHWPKPDKAQKTQFVRSAMQELNKLYSELAEDRDLWTVRMYAMMECDVRNTFCPDDAVRIQRDDGMLSVRSVKLFADGALGSWGSAMISPYSDRPSTRGSSLVNASTLTSLATSWNSAGYQVNIHAIGDLANRWAIDALNASLAASCTSNTTPADIQKCQQDLYRHRIEHAQIIHPDDQARLHGLGIVPSIQPTHATSDMSYALSRLGHDRLNTSAYRMRSLLPLQPILGSDFPVEPPNPFHGMYAAIARKNPGTGLGVGMDGEKGVNASWYGQEALSFAQALRGFTTNPARGAFLEGRGGVISEGAFADWVVLDEEVGLLERDVEALRRVRVRETWVAGRRVYARQD